MYALVDWDCQTKIISVVLNQVRLFYWKEDISMVKNKNVMCALKSGGATAP